VKKVSNKKYNTVERAEGLGDAALSGYVAKKTATNLLPGALGLRTEEHTTSKKTAKKIFSNKNKAGKGFLDPEYGGSSGGASDKVDSDIFRKDSKGHVHITGIKKINSVKSEIKNSLSKRVQRLLYGGVQNIDKSTNNSRDEKIAKGMIKHIFHPFKSNAKTLYTSHSPEWFNKLEEDYASGDMALKSNKKIKVYKNRIAAMIGGLKEHGLSGIKQSPLRALGYLGATGLASSFAYNRGKKAVEKLSK